MKTPSYFHGTDSHKLRLVSAMTWLQRSLRLCVDPYMVHMAVSETGADVRKFVDDMKMHAEILDAPDPLDDWMLNFDYIMRGIAVNLTSLRRKSPNGPGNETDCMKIMTGYEKATRIALHHVRKERR